MRTRKRPPACALAAAPLPSSRVVTYSSDRSAPPGDAVGSWRQNMRRRALAADTTGSICSATHQTCRPWGASPAASPRRFGAPLPGRTARVRAELRVRASRYR
jgi:hypothetical protein